MPISKHTARDGSSSYQVRISIKGQKHYVGTYPTQEKARRAEAKAIVDGRKTRRANLFAFCDLWLAEQPVSAKTLEDYQAALDRVGRILGDISLDRIDRACVDALVPLLLDHYAPSTVRKTIRVLRMAMASAVEKNMKRSEPVKGRMRNLPRVSPKRVNILSQNASESLLAHVEPYWMPAFLLALTSGLRRAELFGLAVEDVDWQKATVTVTRQLTDNGELTERLKTDAAHRTVPLPDRTMQVLSEHLKQVRETDERLLFPTRLGKRVHYPNLNRRVVQPAFLAAGVTGTFHDLRHTYASVLIRSLGEGTGTVNPKMVQTIMGHADIRTTLNVYGHLFPKDEDSVRQVMQDWWNNGKNNEAE